MINNNKLTEWCNQGDLNYFFVSVVSHVINEDKETIEIYHYNEWEIRNWSACQVCQLKILWCNQSLWWNKTSIREANENPCHDLFWPILSASFSKCKLIGYVNFSWKFALHTPTHFNFIDKNLVVYRESEKDSLAFTFRF